MRFGVLALILPMLLAACTPPSGAPGYSGAVPRPENSTSALWEQEWNTLAAAARLEGKVVVKGGTNDALRIDMPRAFKERFGVEMEYLGSSSQDFAIQAEKERAVGIYTADVVIGGAAVMYPTIYPNGWLDPLLPVLTHPDATDVSKWPGGKLWFMDPEQQYILRINHSVIQNVFINTDYVKPGDLKSWYDLLKPEYRGKIIMDDPIGQGAGHLLSTVLYMKLGDDYVKRLLIDQHPLASRDRRQISDQLARGSYPIALGMALEEYEHLTEDHMPIAFVDDLREVSGYTSGNAALVGLMNKAPHPAGAKLFINWVASKEGMAVFSKANNGLPVRTDIDTSSYPKYLFPMPGKEYIDSYDYDFAVNQRLPLSETIRALLR